MFKSKNGQWRKDVWDSKLKKSIPYYFGRIEDDPTGEAAHREWLARKDAIKAGLDKLRAGAVVTGDIRLSELAGKFLAAKRLATQTGLSLPMYRDYMREVQWFVGRVGEQAVVNALRPADFSVVAKLLITGDDSRKAQGNHARKRIIALIKAMFRWGEANGLHNPINFGTDFVGPDTTPEGLRKARARAGKRDNSRRLVTGEEIDKLLERSQAQFKAIVLLSINTGMGPADLGRLRWHQLDLDSRYCPSLPRGKTGNDRAGFLWKKTVQALRRVTTLKHNEAAIQEKGQDALVFISRKKLPMYRETEVIRDGKSVGVKIDNAISGTFSKMAKELGLAGVTQYRLRHTFKTLGKKARDPEALQFMMGHKDRSVGKIYDHEEIATQRIRRVAKVVYKRLWPKPKRLAGTTPGLRLADASREEAA